ncbi:MAG: type IX secretion system membrane protein PorP/SprF [Flavobacteriales bacterium]|nr:type IX secretion system membrane protein PorP/SprF [Flavobacteriales bacterium]
MRHILSFILIISCISTSFAQQDPTFTHYMFNKSSINPGYSGTIDAISITAINRAQWVSFKGAPTTQNITAHMPISNKNIGIGLSVTNEKIGPTQNFGVSGDFAYRIKVNDKGDKLSLGLKANLNYMTNYLTELYIIDKSDASFSQNISTNAIPNFGFGAYYYTKKYFAGLSIPKLLQNSFDASSPAGNSIAILTEQRHYFLIGGTIINLTPDKVFKLKPTSFVKITSGAPIQMDISSSVIYKDKLSAGLSWRTGDALGFLVGINFTDFLQFGYSFDFSYTNTTFKYNTGSHEIMLRYDIVKNKEKSMPKYF